MDRAEVLERLKQIAQDLMASKSGGAAPPAAATAGDETDDLLARYGFNSIDALEYLLALEEEFDIMFEDEDLSQEMVSSADRLADYVIAQRSSKSGLTS